MTMTKWENQLDAIDAAVFSSDMLYDEDRAKVFREFVERWTRAIAEHDKPEPATIKEALATPASRSITQEIDNAPPFMDAMAVLRGRGMGAAVDALTEATATPAVAVQAEPKETADDLIEANPYPTYTFVAQNAAVEQERAERYARTLLRTALAAHPKPAAQSEDARDAARYRWLREEAQYFPHGKAPAVILCGDDDFLQKDEAGSDSGFIYGGKLDAAIDAALATKPAAPATADEAVSEVIAELKEACVLSEGMQHTVMNIAEVRHFVDRLEAILALRSGASGG